jgi:hypothetical protein
MVVPETGEGIGLLAPVSKKGGIDAKNPESTQN